MDRSPNVAGAGMRMSDRYTQPDYLNNNTIHKDNVRAR